MQDDELHRTKAEPWLNRRKQLLRQRPATHHVRKCIFLQWRAPYRGVCCVIILTAIIWQLLRILAVTIKKIYPTFTTSDIVIDSWCQVYAQDIKGLEIDLWFCWHQDRKFLLDLYENFLLNWWAFLSSRLHEEAQGLVNMRAPLTPSIWHGQGSHIAILI